MSPLSEALHIARVDVHNIISKFLIQRILPLYLGETLTK